jgi:hypothetical protein
MFEQKIKCDMCAKDITDEAGFMVSTAFIGDSSTATMFHFCEPHFRQVIDAIKRVVDPEAS